MRQHLKSPASRLFTQSFIQTQIKENIKAPRHWPLCDEFPAQMASYAENISIWWRHHVIGILRNVVHVTSKSSWWLPMIWCRFGASPSTAIIMKYRCISGMQLRHEHDLRQAISNIRFELTWMLMMLYASHHATCISRSGQLKHIILNRQFEGWQVDVPCISFAADSLENQGYNA